MIETVPSGTILYSRYRIERVLGSGGFGHVYLAIDQATGQQCAIKEYLVSGNSGQEQLQHEATVLSHLHHPSLPAFQAAFIENGHYYVVLNYIEGNDLTDLVRIARQRNETIQIGRIITWIISICDAVMFLHSQQPTVIHRDIKPDNIRITPVGTAVLVDLGNAKAAADGARTLFFIRHQGTPGYAPPEQYPGGSGTDARSDVYALGGTLYFALTAHEPPSVSVRNQAVQQGQPSLPALQEHVASNPPEESAEANAARQFRLGVSKPGKPVPRHSRHIAQLGALQPNVLKQLNQIIQKAMALKPRDRYQFVADFANDLKRVVNALPPPPAPPVDPHSTQPDLPGLYDAIQEARENAAQRQQQQRDNPQSAATQSSQNSCARCGTALVPKAVFCPACGTSTSAPGNMQATKTPASAGDISAAQTLVVTKDQLKQAAAQQSVQPQTHMNTPRTASAPEKAGRSFYPTTSPVSSSSSGQQVSVNTWKQASPISEQIAPHTTSTQNASIGFKITPRILIIIMTVIIVLALLAMFFLLKQHG